MVHDPDEWRRPWTEDAGPTLTATAPLASDGAAPVASLASPASFADVSDASAGAGVGAGSAADGGGVGPGAPLATSPLATGWSVRPPDASATVTAPPRARRGVAAVALLSALGGAVLGTGGTFALLELGEDVTAGERPGGAAPAVGSVPAPLIEVDGAESVIPAVAQAVIPSVVRIDTFGGATSGGAVGSGVIYRSDGYVITNNHVVASASTITVRLADGELLDASLIGTDPLNDLAVLRIERTGLPAINLRPADEPLVIGETVVAIGSPFGLDTSVTAGIVSGINREIRVDETDGVSNTIPSAIQTDAAINPGNSGGALVDAQGRLVGINTAILTRTGSNEGVGFAVSVEQAVASADQLIDQGFVRHPLLGITGLDVSREVADRMGLDTTRGAMIDSVQDGSGAADAGLRAGDIVIGLDGRTISTMSELVAEVRRRAPGDRIRLTVVRDRETLDVEVVLGERPRS